MKEFLHILLHSLLDTAYILPVLFVMYFFIEFLEYKNVFKFQNSKLLKGKASPAMGAVFGCVPQCGFSVISAELYSKQKISIGALLAVFIATSDEALPLMLTNYKYIPSLLLLLVAKIIFGLSVGYLAIFLHKKLFKNLYSKSPVIDEHNHKEHHEHEEQDSHDNENEHIHACCHHDTQSNKFNWKHPLLHCIKITLYIFIINLIMGTIIHFVGEETLSSVLKSSSIFQPVLALAIGLIPNCASSVVLTELYLMGGLSFGSIVAGLSVNAGLGFLVLLKQNKNIKENLFVLCMLLIPSLLVGYALHFIPFNLI